MQFAVPQFTEVEDKLIGPLTLKQFLILLATGGLILFFFSILKLSIIFFIFAAPVALVGAAAAFGTFNGRPLFTYSGAIFNYFIKPRERIFKREDISFPTMMKKDEKTQPIVVDKLKQMEGNESRLKKLAYALDQQTKEEQELLKHGQ